MSYRTQRLRSLSLAAVLAIVPMPLISQTAATAIPGKVHGTLRDPLGLPVANAHIDLLVDGPVVSTATSDANGVYSLPAPSGLGRYLVHVTAPSFAPTDATISVTSASHDATLNLTLNTPTDTQQVTVTATGTATPEAQIGASLNVISADELTDRLEVQDPIRLVPGVQMTQTGQMGGTSGLNIRGGDTDANKLLIDGVSANQIGGGVEFANLASVGISTIEVLREPNSALYGSDALAGVVALNSTRAHTPLPLFTYAGDAGNFRTYRDEVTAGTVFHQFDLFSAFARIDTHNSLPNSRFHNATYAGNYGYAPNSANDIRFTVRHVIVSGGQPGEIALNGIADDGQQKEQDNYFNAVWNNQTTDRWHNLVRYGGVRLNGHFNNFGPVGIPDTYGDTDGAYVTLAGANGYKVAGQSLFYYADSAPYSFLSTTRRDFVYAQSDYRIDPHVVALAAFKYENESGASGDAGSSASTIQRGNYSYTLQVSGDVRNRLFYSIGTGLEDNGLFGFAATPRASLAYYLARPSSAGLFAGTKLHGSFGKGIKEPSIFQQTDSAYDALGTQLAAQDHIGQLGAENSRTFDGGVDQQLFNGRVRLGVTYFHNQFTNGVEYVPKQGLIALGYPGNATALQYGAYVNSLSYRAQGLEFESESKLGRHLLARAGYTYTDAVVQHSFTSDSLGPSYNTAFNFSTIAVGVYSPLDGARPFRIAPHTGYFALNYTRAKFYGSLTGTLVGKRDDSTFATDSNFGNSLLLPNRNLLGAYQRLEFDGGYNVTPSLALYTNIQNLLSEHYFEAFGYPSLPLTFRTGIKLNFGGESWKLR